MIQEIGSIIEGCKRGEIKSQTSLFHAYKKKWMGVCVRYVKDDQEAQDVFQDAAISLFREIKTLKEADAFEGWARKIFVNHSLNFLRKKKRYVVMLQDYSGHHEDDFIDDVQVARELDAEELLKVMGRLPDGYRLGATTWSPGASARKQAVAALMPEEKIRAFGPRSRAASVASA